MSLAAVRARILVTLSSVEGISGGNAKVHDFIRYANDEASVKKHFVTDAGRMHCWMIGLAIGDPFLTTNSDGVPGRGQAQEFARYNFTVYGYLAVEDAIASEKTWADQVERVITAFRADKKLGNTVIDSGPLQWVEGPHVMFPVEGGALCHHARLTLRVKEPLSP